MDNRNVGSLFYEIEVHDKNGKLIDKKRGKGDSVLYNWIIMFVGIRMGSSVSMIDVNGASKTIDQIVFPNCSMLAPAGDDSYGIIVGSGTGAVHSSDYNLESKITHGTGSGQLSYGETAEYDAESGLTFDRGLQRSFDNNSGADITVNEIGMVMKINDGTNDYLVMIARDVISATTIPNGGRLTVKYWFRWNPS